MPTTRSGVSSTGNVETPSIKTTPSKQAKTGKKRKIERVESSSSSGKNRKTDRGRDNGQTAIENGSKADKHEEFAAPIDAKKNSNQQDTHIAEDDGKLQSDETSQRGNSAEQSSKTREGLDNSADTERSSESKRGQSHRDADRKKSMPSSILEKGIIYFFFRGRVDVEEPGSIEDIARSYIVLCPIPLGARLGDNKLDDNDLARLLALPKKVLPKSHRDRFMLVIGHLSALD